MNQLAIALLGSGGFIGSHVAQFCLESGIPIIELPRWEGNRKKFDEKIRELKLMHPEKRIVFLQAAWYSTNNSDYRSSSENHEWVKTTKLILEICEDHEIIFAGLGTCLEKETIGHDKYTLSKSEIHGYLRGKSSKKKWIWFQLHYVYSEQHLKPAVLRKAAEASDAGEILILGTPNDRHDFIEVRDAAAAIVHSLLAGLNGVVEIGIGSTVEVSSLLRSLFPKLEIIKAKSEGKQISYQGAAATESLVDSSWAPKFSFR